MTATKAQLQATIDNLQCVLGGAQQRLDEAAEVKRRLDFEIWELKQEVEKCHIQRNQDVLLLQNLQEQVELHKASNRTYRDHLNVVEAELQDISARYYKPSLAARVASVIKGFRR